MKLSKSIVDENFRGLAEKILDEHYASGMHWKTVNRDNVLLAMKEYASQAVNLALGKACDLVQEKQLNDQPINGRDILSLEKSIIKKLK